MRMLFILPVAFLLGESHSIKLRPDNTELALLENTEEKIALKYKVSHIKGFDVETEEGVFSELSIPQGHYIGSIGTPKLPARKELIEIPFGAEVSIRVTGYNVEEYALDDLGITQKLMPVQPSISKSADMDKVKFEYDEPAYNRDAFSDHELASIEVLGTLRGMRIARVVLAPVRYNPITNRIRMYNDLVVQVDLTGSNQDLTKYIKASTYSPYFDVVYQSVLNGRDQEYPDHPDLTKFPVKYLIVSDPMFETVLQPFIEWKTMKGFEVIIGYTNDIGSSVANIQNWILGHYNNGTPDDPAPSFVLFVGDVQQVPASASGSATNKMTDLYYCSIDGDYFPEMYYGRFSAMNTSQLQAQINKTLYYEKYEFENPSYLDDVTLIAGADGYWNSAVGQPTILYGTQNYYNSLYGFSQINSYLNSYSGCYDTVDEGIGVILYTAHGTETEWSSPNLSISAVNNFNNPDIYPLAIGNACLTGDFGYSECIGETWVRKANGGAVAYIGSSPSSYWFEDFYWAVGAFPISGNNGGYVPTYEETSWGLFDGPFASDYVSTDALVFVGNLAVTEVDIQGYPSHSSPLYYWQAYNVLGDPSLVIYQTQGEVNNVNYMDALPIGIDFFEVSAEPGSYVAISFNGTLHGTAMIGEQGIVEVPITPIYEPGMADIVITKPQFQPVMNQVLVTPLDGPYVTIDEFTVDAGGDGVIEFGETVLITVTLENVGSDPATDVEMTLSEDDEYITLIDDSEGFGTILPEGTYTQTYAYSFTVSNSVPDDHLFELAASITADEDTWESSMHMTAYAPVISAGTIQVTNDDNGNGRLDPGESADIGVTLDNDGGAVARNLSVFLSTSDPFLTINVDSGTLESLEAYSNAQVVFSVSVSEDTEIGHNVLFDLSISADNDYNTTDSFTLSVGLVLEDFEMGSFAGYPWEFGGNGPWTISTEAYEGTYSAQSGAIANNQTSEMYVSVNVTTDGEISFYYKVSSEASYDYLRFYIDGSEMGAWSGEVNWLQAAYPVSQGEHTFRWKYEKDWTVSNGSDCAWIDYIIFPSVSPPQYPDISVTPMSLEANVESGGTAEENLTISNSGEGVLNYSVIIATDSRQSADFISYKLGKGEVDTRPGVRSEKGFGGPDEFGYYWIDSDEESGPDYDWIEINSVGIALTGDAMDDYSWGSIDLGFDFSFYGNMYDMVNICSNGFITFTSSSTTYSNQEIPNAGEPNTLLALFWDDLNPNNGGTIYYHEGFDRFIVEWDGVPHYGNGGGPETFQVIINANGTIIYQYKTVDTGDGCTVGIENATGTDGLQVVFNSSYLHDEMAILFYAEDPWLTVSPMSGSIDPDGSANLMVTFNAEELEEGEYTASIIISSNDPDEYNISVPVILTVGADMIVEMTVDHFEDWNMVGLPLAVEDANVMSVFPDAVENTMYSFGENGYEQEQELAMGSGYWLRFDEEGSNTISGEMVSEITVNLLEDWNMISGCSESNSGWIDPDGLVIPNTLYSFGENGYENANSIEPGLGYWVRSYGEGQIIISSDIGLAKSKPVSLDGLKYANTISFNGNTLYFGVEIPDREALSYGLPPKPPAGGFDVRFADNMKCMKESGMIEIMNNSDQLIISYNVKIDDAKHINWVLINPVTHEEFTLTRQGVLEVSGEISNFELRKVPEIPESFSLSQNYPNPFNPVTQIQFELPRDDKISLKVYNLKGEEVRNLVSGTYRAGYHTIRWNGTNQDSEPVASGVYIYMLEAGTFHSVKKMLLMK